MVLALLAFSPAAVSAAEISWFSPQEITGESDVSTNGTPLLAINASQGDGLSVTTANGVDFVNASLINLPAGFTTDIGNDNANAFQAGGLADAMGTLIQSGFWGGDTRRSPTRSVT